MTISLKTIQRRYCPFILIKSAEYPTGSIIYINRFNALTGAFIDQPFLGSEADIIRGIDLATEEIIMDLLQKEKAKGKTVLIVSHDLHSVKQTFDWLILLNRRLVACGPIQEVLKKEHLLAAFGKGCSLFEDVSLLSTKAAKGFW